MPSVPSRRWFVTYLTVGLMVPVCQAFAQTENSYPMLMSLRPTAVQIGQTGEAAISARYSLDGATQVFVSGDGVTAEALAVEEKPEEPSRRGRGRRRNTPSLKLKFTVAANVVPGVRDFRLLTSGGVSTVGQLVLTRDPVFSESGDNDTLSKAQPVTLPAAVCGAIEKAEDIDCFKFTAAAGQTLTFHVRSQRLQNRLHDMQTRVDPMITLRNATGSTLAASDNVYAGDPLLVHTFEQAGEYVLEVRDVRYQGNADWTYCVEINDRPFVTQVHPLAVAPGAASKLGLVGMNLPGDPTLSLTLPAETPHGLGWIAPPLNGTAANAFATYVTPLPIQVEAAGDNNEPAKGQVVPFPSVIAGVIESPADLDCYTFEAKKGDRLTFETIARRAGSALDSTVRIVNEQGGQLAEFDDLQEYRVGNSDSLLEFWSAPADGKFTLQIRDLHLRGGKAYPYALQITRAEPYFELLADTDKTLLSPGTSAPFYVNAVRKNGFAGEIALAVDNLPPGVTATCGRILANGQDGCVILTAAADARPVMGNIKITGSGMHAQADGSMQAVTAVAKPLQETYSPGGGRIHYPVDVHTVSVSEPMDIRAVKLSTTDIALKPGESKRIEVEIERAPEFKGNVTLDVLFQHLERPYGNSLPKGVTLDGGNSKTLLTGTESKGHITLKAAADAPPVEKQLVPAMANVSVNFVMKMTYCGQPVWITVQPK